jgi:hypothetical protein
MAQIPLVRVLLLYEGHVHAMAQTSQTLWSRVLLRRQ